MNSRAGKKLGQDVANLDPDIQSLVNDEVFVKNNGISSMKEINGREKSLIALHNTFKNIDKSE